MEVVYAGTVGAASVAFAIFCVPYQTEVMLSVAVSNVLTGSQPELHDDGGKRVALTHAQLMKLYFMNNFIFLI